MSATTSSKITMPPVQNHQDLGDEPEIPIQDLLLTSPIAHPPTVSDQSEHDSIPSESAYPYQLGFQALPKAAHRKFRMLPPARPGSAAFAEMMASGGILHSIAPNARMDVDKYAEIMHWLDRVTTLSWTPPLSIEEAIRLPAIRPIHPSTVAFRENIEKKRFFREYCFVPCTFVTNNSVEEDIMYEEPRAPPNEYVLNEVMQMPPPIFRFGDVLQGLKVVGESDSPPYVKSASTDDYERDIFARGHTERFPRVDKKQVCGDDSGEDDEVVLII